MYAGLISPGHRDFAAPPRVSGSYHQSAPAQQTQLGSDMALRMICRTLTSRSLAAIPRAAPTHCSPSCSLLRHAAAAGLNRPAWRSETTSLINLRSFNASTVARSALTDILQDEIDHEKENYQPPEVRTSNITWTK